MTRFYIVAVEDEERNLDTRYVGQIRSYPELIHCRECRKQNKRVGFDENFKPVYKEDACPLISWRGIAKGHEFDYQFCCCAERKEE